MVTPDPAFPVGLAETFPVTAWKLLHGISYLKFHPWFNTQVPIQHPGM